MKKLYIILIGIIVLIAGLGFTYAQVVSSTVFPPSFTITLDPLPQQQSPNQMFFGGSYGVLELRDIEVYAINGVLNPEVDFQIRYWVNNRASARSLRTNITINPSLSPSGTVSNFETALNNYFLQEALANNQPTNILPTPISSGGST